MSTIQRGESGATTTGPGRVMRGTNPSYYTKDPPPIGRRAYSPERRAVTDIPVHKGLMSYDGWFMTPRPHNQKYNNNTDHVLAPAPLAPGERPQNYVANAGGPLGLSGASRGLKRIPDPSAGGQSQEFPVRCKGHTNHRDYSSPDMLTWVPDIKPRANEYDYWKHGLGSSSKPSSRSSTPNSTLNTGRSVGGVTHDIPGLNDTGAPNKAPTSSIHTMPNGPPPFEPEFVKRPYVAGRRLQATNNSVNTHTEKAQSVLAREEPKDTARFLQPKGPVSAPAAASIAPVRTSVARADRGETPLRAAGVSSGGGGAGTASRTNSVNASSAIGNGVTVRNSPARSMNRYDIITGASY